MPTETPGPKVPPHVLDYLSERKILTLATVSATAVPRATTLTYVNDGLSVYIWTRPETITARHVGENPVVSFAIDEFTSDFHETKGIQATGECSAVLNPAEITRVTELFEQKFPALEGTLTNDVAYFRITPTELQFIDNTAGGGEASSAGGIDFHRDLVYSVFRNLPAQEAATIEAKLRTIEVPAGEVVVRQGAPADKFFIILDGEVEVVREDDGQTRTLATLRRGQFFGEMAILRDLPRMATVKAITPTTLFAMERDAFRSVVAQSMGTTEDFDRVINQRLEEIREHS
jgi:uncharacterized protein YhbP (UPF0306 family)